MITAFAASGACLNQLESLPSEPGAAGDIVWFDLVAPTPEEDALVETLIGVSVPTRDEMLEIEPSNRLYVEDGALYMTATLICHSETARPTTAAVTFILAGHQFVTVRYDEPRPFALFHAKVQKFVEGPLTGPAVCVGLLDSVIDRLADVLERVGVEIDGLSSIIFGDETKLSNDYARSLKAIGREGGLVSKVQESLVSLARLLAFLATEGPRIGLAREGAGHAKALSRDVKSLADYAVSLDNKLTFLLDATLGLVGIQQNNIVKIFSVLAVVFLPPTLIASIYGMNFDIMPELNWVFGYPFALALMVASIATTFIVFRWKRWL